MWWQMLKNTGLSSRWNWQLILWSTITHICVRDEHDLVDKDNLVAKVLKTRENRKTAERSWKKLAIQIRGIIIPETLKRSRLTKIEVPDGDEGRKVEDKEITEEHLMERNIEQLSHAGKTPFGYSYLGAELGHTGDSQMANIILEGTLKHECLSNESIRAIVNQLREHPMVQRIWKPIVTPEDFTSCFKYVPEKYSIVIFRPIGTTLQSVLSDHRGRNR
jgi:hypothetical protein